MQQSKLLAEILELASIDNNDSRAWQKFSQLNQEQQQEVFNDLLATANKQFAPGQKAIQNPGLISMFKRKLKPGVTFPEFYQAWLPPVTPTFSHGSKFYDYYPVATRVMNFVPNTKSDEFLSIAFIHNPYTTVENLMHSLASGIKENDQNRYVDIDDLLIENSTPQFYTVASDDIFGK